MFMDEGHHGNGSGPATRDRRPRGVPAGALFHARLHDADAVRYRHEVPLPPFVPLTWTWASPGSASPTPTLLAEQLGEAARQLGARLRRHQDDLAAALTAAVELLRAVAAQVHPVRPARPTEDPPQAGSLENDEGPVPPAGSRYGSRRQQPATTRGPTRWRCSGWQGRTAGSWPPSSPAATSARCCGSPWPRRRRPPGRLAVADVRGHHRLVPAFRATGPDLLEGGLRLANP